jgi:glutamate synthase (ferredoxin)
LTEIEKEIKKKVSKAFPNSKVASLLSLRNWRDLQMETNRRKHMFNPTTIAKLQQAVRLNSPESYKEYSNMVNDQSEN